MELKERTEQLRQQIRKHEYNYLILVEKSISDFELESLKLELLSLEKSLEREENQLEEAAH